MKISLLTILISGLFLFPGCDKDPESNATLIADLQGTWNLFQVTGGFAGVNCMYEVGESVWTFENTTLTIVTNIVNTEPICSGTGIGSSTQEFEVLTQNGQKFLLLNGFEAGELVISASEFSLDQNSFTQGQGADGFGYGFKK